MHLIIYITVTCFLVCWLFLKKNYVNLFHFFYKRFKLLIKKLVFAKKKKNRFEFNLRKFKKKKKMAKNLKIRVKKKKKLILYKGS